MALVKTIALENGTNGNSLTTALTGYEAISGTAATYSNAWAPTGLTLSARAVTTTATSIYRGTLTTALASPFYRKYEKLTNLPSADTAIVQGATSGGVYACEVQMRTTGIIRIRNASSTAVATSAHTFAAGDAFRLEWNPQPGGTQTLRLFWGANIDGTTPDETLSGTTGGSGTIGRFLDGTCNSATFTHAWAGVAVDDTTWVGPAAPGTPIVPGYDAKSWSGSAWVTGIANGRTATPAWVVGDAHSWDGQNWIPVNSTIPPSTSRFPGDPGQGKYYMEAIYDNNSTGSYQAQDVTIRARMSAYTPAQTRAFSIHRIYAGADTTLPATEFTWALDNDRLPLVSFKGAPTSITSGSLDGDLNTLVGQFNTAKAQGKAVWWCYWHEPEDDFTSSTTMAQYRAAQRYCYAYFKAAGCDNIAHVAAFYMNDNTFSSSSGRLWWNWWPDWKGTNTGNRAWNNPNPVDFYPKGDANAVVDILGLDTYSTYTGRFVFGSNLSQYTPTLMGDPLIAASNAIAQASGAAYPITIGELGFVVKQSGTFSNGLTGANGRGWTPSTYYEADTSTMLAHLKQTIADKDVVGFSYWNQTINTGGWWKDVRLLEFDPNYIRDKWMADMSSDAKHVHPPTPFTP